MKMLASSYVFFGILTFYAGFREQWVLVAVLSILMGIVASYMANLEAEDGTLMQLYDNLKAQVYTTADSSLSAAREAVMTVHHQGKMIDAQNARIQALEAQLKDLADSASLSGWVKGKKV